MDAVKNSDAVAEELKEVLVKVSLNVLVKVTSSDTVVVADGVSVCVPVTVEVKIESVRTLENVIEFEVVGRSP